MTKTTSADEYIEAELALLSQIDKALFKLNSEQRLRILNLA